MALVPSDKRVEFILGFTLDVCNTRIPGAIGAAIVDRGGSVVGAVNIAAPSPRLSITRLQQRFGAALMRTAAEVSRNLGTS